MLIGQMLSLYAVTYLYPGIENKVSFISDGTAGVDCTALLVMNHNAASLLPASSISVPYSTSFLPSAFSLKNKQTNQINSGLLTVQIIRCLINK